MLHSRAYTVLRLGVPIWTFSLHCIPARTLGKVCPLVPASCSGHEACPSDNKDTPGLLTQHETLTTRRLSSPKDKYTDRAQLPLTLRTKLALENVMLGKPNCLTLLTKFVYGHSRVGIDGVSLNHEH